MHTQTKTLEDHTQYGLTIREEIGDLASHLTPTHLTLLAEHWSYFNRDDETQKLTPKMMKEILAGATEIIVFKGTPAEYWADDAAKTYSGDKELLNILNFVDWEYYADTRLDYGNVTYVENTFDDETIIVWDYM